MSCDEIRGALPLLDGDDAGEAEAVRAHLAVCPTCEEFAAGFDADAASLVEYRSLLEVEQPALDGFADAVMAIVATSTQTHESKGAPVAVAPILRPSFGPMLWMAAAAALLLALGLGMSAVPRYSTEAIGPTAKNTTETTPSDPSAPAVKISLPSAEEVPAPRRLVRPRRTRRNVMPVNSDGRRGARGNADFMNAIERLWGRGQRQVPQLREGEREVRF